MNERFENGMRLVAQDSGCTCQGCHYENKDCPTPAEMCEPGAGRTDGRRIIWVEAEAPAKPIQVQPLTDAEIAAAVRPLYGNFPRSDRTAEEGLAFDTSVARAIERTLASTWGVTLAEREGGTA